METSLKAGFAQIFSCCPKNLSCPKFGGAAAPLAPPARTPMRTNKFSSTVLVRSEGSWELETYFIASHKKFRNIALNCSFRNAQEK